ncbi:MAG: peptidylprolyl isomerase [Mycobacterium leprae]
MSGRDRERWLARQRYERRLTRRAAARARRRRRWTMLGAALGVAALVAGAALVVSRLVSDRGPAREAARETTQEKMAAGSVRCRFRAAGPAAGPAAHDVGTPSPDAPDARAAYVATIVTDRGDITVELAADKAPCAGWSLRYLAGRGFFDNTSCHRLTTGPGLFVLQCGDPTGTGRGGPGYVFGDENLRAFGSGAPVTYPAGTLAMANSGPGANGSQFFLVYRDSRLDPAYTPFGRVTSGLGVVRTVAAAGTVAGDKPRLPVRISDVRVVRRP